MITDGKKIQELYHHSLTSYTDDLYTNEMYQNEIHNYSSLSEDNDDDDTSSGQKNGKPTRAFKTASVLPRMKVVDTPDSLKSYLSDFYGVGGEHFSKMASFEDLRIEFSIKHFDSNIKEIFNTLKNFIVDNVYADVKSKKISTTTYFPIWFNHMIHSTDINIDGVNLKFPYCNIMGKMVNHDISMQAVIEEFNYRVPEEYRITTKPSATGGEFKVVMSNNWKDKMNMYKDLEGVIKTCQTSGNTSIDSYARGYCDLFLSPSNGVGTIYNASGKAEGRFVFRIMYDTSDIGGDASLFNNMYIVIDRLYAFSAFADKLTEYSWQIPYELMKLGYKVVCGNRFIHGDGGGGGGTNVKASNWVDLCRKGNNKVSRETLGITLRTPARPCLYTTHSYYQDSEGIGVYSDKDNKIKVDYIRRNNSYIFSLK